MAYFTINGYDSYSGCDIVVTASIPLKTQEGEGVYFTLGSLQTLSVSTHQDKRPVRSLGNINAKDYVMGQRTIAGSLVFAVFDRHFADKIMKSAEVLMADEIPALNLTINFANEYGRSSRMAIYGVKLLNEGQVMSINDLYTENTYQFVALGMEPLTADEEEGMQGNYIKPGPPMYNPGSPTEKPKDSEDKKFEDSNGKIISDKIKNNADYQDKENVILSATIEQPIEGETSGIASITLKPVQSEGFIYITNLVTNVVEYSIVVNGSNVYNLDLPIGYYNARYMNTTRTRESNLEKMVVRVNNEAKNAGALSKGRMIHPVVDKITDDSISVSIGDKSFKDIVCYTSGDAEEVLPNKGVVTFNNLKADTDYRIFGRDKEGNETEMAMVKTFPDNMTYYNKFKSYLQSNRGMMQNDYDTVIATLESLLSVDYSTNKKVWPFDNIIDGVSTLENSLIKQELLLYAMNFENSMSYAYNKQNPNKLNVVRNDIFDTDFTTGNWNSIKCYSKKETKNKLETIVSDEKGFEGQPNKAYSLYGSNENGDSVKQYITVFSEEGKEFLNKYRDVNKYKTLDLTYNKAKYPTLDTEELYAVSIRDNLLCDRELIDEPYVYIEDDKIYADVTYNDKMLLDNTYYLCMSDMYSTLDVTPKRKEPFNRSTKIINLDNAYMPFDVNSIYHFWVENALGNIISKAFIFNYKQSKGLERALDKELKTILNNKKLLLNDVIDNSTAINDIIYDLYCSAVPKKDINTRLEYALLEYGINSRFVSNPLEDYLYQAVLINNSNKLEINRVNAIDIYKHNDSFRIKSGSDLSVKVLVKSFDLKNQEVNCTIHNTDISIEFKGNYMAIFLMNDFVDKILGFIVIDCNSYKYKELGFNVRVGDR